MTSGPRYNPSDFEEYAISVPELPHRDPFAGDFEPATGLLLNADATPPLAKYEALKENDPKFKKSVERKRSDLQDQSPSAYDFSLAAISARANWTDQEIANLIIYCRFKNGDDLAKALRPDYIPKIIGKIRAGLKYEEAISELDDWHQERSQPEAGPDDSRREILRQLIRTVLEIDVLRVVQYGVDNPEFEVHTPTGRIVVGPVNGLISEVGFRTAAAIAYRKYIPHFKREQWRSIAQALLDLIEVVDTGPDGKNDGPLRYWVETYIQGNPPGKKEHSTLATAAPFRDEDGSVWFTISNLAKHVRLCHGEPVSTKQLTNLLSQVGSSRQSPDYRKADGTWSSRSYWMAPGSAAVVVGTGAV